MKTIGKHSKRFLSLLLSICMVLSLLTGILPAASAAGVTEPVTYDGVPVTPTIITASNYWNFGLTESTWGQFNGYYGIRNAKELYGFANLVNGGQRSIKGVLLQDIVINETVSESGATYSWTPIGNTWENSFCGTFDGNGHTISGLYVDGTQLYAGLFGVLDRIGKGAASVQIRDVILANSLILNATYSESLYNYTGGIASYIMSCNTVISGCKIGADVTVKRSGKNNRPIGGIVGGGYYTQDGLKYYYSTVEDCVVLGKVVDDNNSIDMIGGIAGYSKDAYYDNNGNIYKVQDHFYVKNSVFLGTTIEIYANGELVPISKIWEAWPNFGYTAVGGVRIVGGTYTGHGGDGCIRLSYADSSHSCKTVTHTEVLPTCAGFPGRSGYSFCLICDKITEGSKTDSPSVDHVYMDATCQAVSRCETCDLTRGDKDPDNHVSTLWKVNPENKKTHIYTHDCCGIVLETENHSMDSNQYCSTCDYQCEHYITVNGVCQVCGISGITFIDRQWDSETNTVEKFTFVASTIKAVTSDTTTLSDGWYAVESDVTVNGRITVTGTANLILMDGCTLTASQGITTTDATLNIYSKSDDSGTIVANGSRYAAGIGSMRGNNCGNINIYGGTIRATGGQGGAGIGNGLSGQGGTVTIYGGNVYAKAGAKENTIIPAGIGSGGSYNGKSSAPNITIHGGYVEARGSCGDSVGIGASIRAASCGTIRITGGTVNAVGGSTGDPGIGSAPHVNNGELIITGGTIRSRDSRNSHKIGPDTSTSTCWVKDGQGKTVSLVTVTLQGAMDASYISSAVNFSYGTNDVRTMDGDKLYYYMATTQGADYYTIGDTIYCGGGNKTYYSPDSHLSGNAYYYENDEHYRLCDLCDTKVDVATHSGGNPDCLSNGYCTTCGVEYLPVKADNHAYSETYIKYTDDSSHSVYRSCCNTLVETLAHVPAENQEATCTGVATCADCGMAYGGTDATNHTGSLVFEAYAYDQRYHYQKYDCCGMTVTGLLDHNLNFTVSGNTISTACSDCGADGSITLVAPAEALVYSGYTQTNPETLVMEGILSGYNGYYDPEVAYCCGRYGCIETGEHTVSLTVNGYTVTDTYTIAPKPLTIEKVVAFDKVYDGTNSLDIYAIYLDGVVIYDTGAYEDLDFDDIRDDVALVQADITYSFDGVIPGSYSTIDVSGVTITGEDAHHYTIAASFEDVPLENNSGYELYISYADVRISAENQTLVGDAALDPTAYTVEGLPEGFTLENVVLEADDYGCINIDTSIIKITLDGADVTEYFYINAYSGNLARVCEGHTFDDNGFCATGTCQAYEPAEFVLNEFGERTYTIENAGQLYWFAEQVNRYVVSGAAILAADIVINEDLTAENLRVWTPIDGLYADFDGSGYTISGLYIDSTEDYVGLFGNHGYYAVKNLTIANSYIKGNQYVGAIAGYTEGSFNNCVVAEDVTVVGSDYTGGMIG